MEGRPTCAPCRRYLTDGELWDDLNAGHCGECGAWSIHQPEVAEEIELDALLTATIHAKSPMQRAFAADKRRTCVRERLAEVKRFPAGQQEQARTLALALAQETSARVILDEQHGWPQLMERYHNA